MPILEVDLNCMCLFVPDPQPGTDQGTVHVLMPCTHHHTNEDLHVAQLGYADAAGNPARVRLEGWALGLGNARQPTAACRLEEPDRSRGEMIVNLTDLTQRNAGHGGRRVPRAMLDAQHPDVVARVSFYGGNITQIEPQWPNWLLDGKRVDMAHQVTWRIELDSPQLAWTALCGSGRPCPLASLADVQAESEGGETVYRLHIHHVAATARDESGAPRLDALTESEIRNHFRMFYMLLGQEPRDDQLPVLPPEVRAQIEDPEGGGSRGYACKVAQAETDPLVVA
jgi:hypothetical protein